MFKKILLGITEIQPETKYAAPLAVDEEDQSAALTKIIEDFDLSKRTFEDLILAMYGSSNAGRVAWNLVLVDRAKTLDLTVGHSALAYKKLREKYAPQLAPSYGKLNKMFINSELTSVDNDPEMFFNRD